MEQAAEYSRKYRAANKEKIAAYVVATKAARAVYARRYREEHREQANESSRRWRERNPEAVKARNDRYLSENRESLRDRYRKYDAAHRRERADKANARRRANKEQYRLNESHRRARKRAAEGRYSLEDIRLLDDSQRGKCANSNCRTSLSGGYEIDHIMPLVLGGSNWPDNLQLLCPKCNRVKKDRHPDIWARENGLLFHL